MGSNGSGRVRKIIIDTDPGIDDSMAIACVFNSPEFQIIGMTSIFGNVQTAQATKNCFFLLDMAGRPDVCSWTIIKTAPWSKSSVLHLAMRQR